MRTGWYVFLAWHRGDAAGQRPPFSIFFTMTYFWSESKVGLFQFLLAWQCEVILGWSFFLFALLVILSFGGFFTLDGQKIIKKRILLFFLTAVYSAWSPGCPSNAAHAKQLGIFLEISTPVLCLYPVWSFTLMEVCVGERGLAQSSLATPCITRMQMSYEAIHLLEMPPWFQFESCLQSHCVSPLLHVKEVSLCERSEGDNCT